MHYIDKQALIYDSNKVTIEENVYIGPFCMIGGEPEIKGFIGPDYGVVIRSGTIITALASVDGGSKRTTEVGMDCYITKKCYVGHDAILMNNIVMSPNSTIGGHCVIWPYAVLGMHSCIHQYHELAPGAMLGMGCVLPKSAKTEPFTIYTGHGQRLRENTKLLNSLPTELVNELVDKWNNR